MKKFTWTFEPTSLSTLHITKSVIEALLRGNNPRYKKQLNQSNVSLTSYLAQYGSRATI